ncbi:MAG: alpha/beta hydrolase-fold protein [Bacteroidota bacterium]
MKHNLLTLQLLPLLALFLLSGQNETDIVIGKRIQLASEILKSNREISIYLPRSYYHNDYTQYPVLYVLDGEKFFHAFSGAVEQLSSDASPQMPEAIVVGIRSQNRLYDSSPTQSTMGYLGKEDKAFAHSGGATIFIDFITKELIPYVDTNYRTNSYRTFVGYSFTGLPVLHALFTRPEMFNSYLVIDFSAWWDDRVTWKNAKSFFKNYKGPKRDIYLTTVDRVLDDYSPRHNETWSFIKDFKQNHSEHISLGYKKYAYREENHHTLALISFIDGLKYIFRGHMMNRDEMYTHPEVIAEKFEQLSDRLGYTVFPREDLINYLGYFFVYSFPDYDKALLYFMYNARNYPASVYAWDGLAEGYKAKGNTKKAIESFEKALEIDPKNESIAQRLAELRH